MKVPDHVYVVPDDNVRFVPNVGIIVGERSTLVVDTGLGPRNAAIILSEVEKVSSNEELYVVRHSLPPRTRTGRGRISGNSNVASGDFTAAGH